MLPLKLLCQAEPPMQSADLRESHTGHLAVEIDRIQIGHPGNKVDDGLDIGVEIPGFTGNNELFGDQLQQFL